MSPSDIIANFKETQECRINEGVNGNSPIGITCGDVTCTSTGIPAGTLDRVLGPGPQTNKGFRSAPTTWGELRNFVIPGECSVGRVTQGQFINKPWNPNHAKVGGGSPKWVRAGRKVTLKDGSTRSLYMSDAFPGELRIKRMKRMSISAVSKENKTRQRRVATYVKPKTA